MNVAEWHLEHTRRYGDDVGLVTGEQEFTNAALYDSACRLASAMHALGIRPGDRAAVAVPNSAELFIAAHAVYLAGLVLVVLPDNSEAESASMVRHCGARVCSQVQRFAPIA